MPNTAPNHRNARLESQALNRPRNGGNSTAGVVNGLGHYWGYRNYELPDASTNFMPWGILIGGEELHNNHHAFPSSAKFSSRWWELDLGWLHIRALCALGLARVKKIAPKPMRDSAANRDQSPRPSLTGSPRTAIANTSRPGGLHEPGQPLQDMM